MKDPNDRDNEERKETVQDDGSVDQRVKDRILSARESVDETETHLFVSAAAAPEVRLSQAQLATAWGTVVRQYIRSIEPLLRSDNVEAAARYYHEIPIHEQIIPPPDTEDNDWSRFAAAENPAALAREMGLPQSFKPPKPKRVTVRGLKDVLDKKEERLVWSFAKNPDAIPPQRERVRLEETWFPQKETLDHAVRKADEFLQQAGIGLEISSGDPVGHT